MKYLLKVGLENKADISTDFDRHQPNITSIYQKPKQHTAKQLSVCITYIEFLLVSVCVNVWFTDTSIVWVFI